MRSVTVPITLINLQDDGFHLLVEIVVFGLKRFAVVDTGASRSVFDLSFLKWHLPELEYTEETQATTLFTTSGTFQATIPLLKIGRLKLEHYEMVALDLEGVNQAYESWGHPVIVAIIGSDLLLKYNAVIDYKKMKLYLRGTE
jgi:hypothetical protein